MEIIINKHLCEITPLTPIINKIETERIVEAILTYKGYKICINLENVLDCTINFIDMINNFNNLYFYNINSDIFAIFNKMGLDNKANLYSSEIDLKSNKNRLINRNFTLLKL